MDFLSVPNYSWYCSINSELFFRCLYIDFNMAAKDLKLWKLFPIRKEKVQEWFLNTYITGVLSSKKHNATLYILFYLLIIKKSIETYLRMSQRTYDIMRLGHTTRRYIDRDT